jgi:hypothetical protein
LAAGGKCLSAANQGAMIGAPFVQLLAGDNDVFFFALKAIDEIADGNIQNC